MLEEDSNAAKDVGIFVTTGVYDNVGVTSLGLVALDLANF
ncbi:hypothetical protein CKA32_006876 [Geitlerinema sp. FC II]|nr:hypothetical protein CKA32_006876 [Geitlerinema sp. FC II]